MNLSTTLANISLQSCIYNASGALCVTLDELLALSQSNTGIVLTKSCTLDARAGNSKPRYYTTPLGSINSSGLPNLGYQMYLDTAAQVKGEKPFILSIAGLTFEDNLTIMRAANKCAAVDAIELNLSCPNIVGKPQTGYDPKQSDRLMAAFATGCTKPWGVKLPPYYDSAHFNQMADILKKYPTAFVVCINSPGYGLIIDPETETVTIKPNKGHGGIGGSYTKPTALANVRKFYELLPGVDIVGVGGVQTGLDVFEFILAGATAVQVGTQLIEEGLGCLERLENELSIIMQRKGYKTINDFKGKLKIL